MMAAKHNTAIICFSPYFGGMEMDAFRIAKLLSQSINTTLIVKENSIMHTRYCDEVRKHNIRLETINFSFTLSPSIIFKTRKLIINYNIKNIIYFGASEMSSLYFSFMSLNINLIHSLKCLPYLRDLLYYVL